MGEFMNQFRELQLQARITELENQVKVMSEQLVDQQVLKDHITAVQNSNYSLMEAINRRVDIETYMILASKGSLPLPDKEDCRMMALILGTPLRHWSKLLRKYEFGLRGKLRENMVSKFSKN